MDLPRGKILTKVKGINVPFYAVPDNVKVSSEIINEARASVRSVDTKRPFTPREDHRRLFENVSRPTRPPSACRLDNLMYEPSDLTINTSPHRLNPLQNKQERCRVAKSKDPHLKTSLPQSASLLKSDEFVVGRQITSAPGRVRLPSITPIKPCFQRNLDKLPEETASRSHMDVLNSSISDASVDIKPEEPVWEKKCRLSFKQIISSERSQTCGAILDNFDDEYFSSIILPLLEQLILYKKSGEMESNICLVLKQLYITLQDGHLFENNHKQRTLILKTIFKLFDSKNCSLLLQVARICLAMNVTGNNLSSISKVLFKVTRNENNDTLFLEDNTLELYLHSISSMNTLRDTDALIYGIGSLKFLAMNASLLREISHLNGVKIICYHIKKITDHKMTASDAICDQIFHVLFQLTGCLRNLSENPMNRKIFITSGTVDELCKILKLFAEDLDIIMNVARILSKLTMYYEVCNRMTENAKCFSSLIDLLNVYKNKPDVVVRLCFAFGNITAKNDVARHLMYQQPNSLNVLLDLIQVNFDKKSGGFGDRQRDLLPFTTSTLVEIEEPDISEDVVVKVIRLLTNMSISFEVGHQIAQSEKYIDLIITILGTKDVDRHEELVFSVLAALSNISYYATDSDVIRIKLIQLVTILLRFLFVNHQEILIESLRIFGNISRTEDAMKQLANMKVIETAIGYLESENKDIVYLSCGLLMNFMTKETNCKIMTKESGLEKILKILKEFGQQDWQLASVICQTLWNYTCSSMETVNFSELYSVLNMYLDESQAFDTSVLKAHEPGKAIARDIWQLEFHPIAFRLLNKIKHRCYAIENIA